MSDEQAASAALERAKKRFASLGMNQDQLAEADLIRRYAQVLSMSIDNIGMADEHGGASNAGPHSPARYKALAQTALEEAVMWANKALSRS